MTIEGKQMCAGVAGTGLVGTSIGLALRRAGWRTVGYDVCPAAAANAQAMGGFDVCVVSLEQLAGPEVDLVFVCVPPGATVPTVEALLAAGASAVTDVASVKVPVVAALDGRHRFLGGHPMAGGETGGPGAARASLFDGANWVLTPGRHSASSLVDLVAGAVRDTGARPVMLDPGTHDQCVALVSHLPHVVAAALASVVAHDPGGGQARRLVAAGWLQTTRVASGPADLWADILLHNAEAVIDAIDAFVVELCRFRESLRARDHGVLHDGLLCAAATRDGLLVGAAGNELSARRAAPRPGGVRTVPSCVCGLPAAG